MARRNQLGEQFISHSREMRESPAWAALSWAARRVLDRMELEHMHHGGAENGKLVVTYDDFARAGIRRKSVSEAMRECVALGFVEVTTTGGRSHGGSRAPSTYRLTYVVGRKKSGSPSHDWRRIKTEDDAKTALDPARLNSVPRGRECPQSRGRKRPQNHSLPGGENAPASLVPVHKRQAFDFI